MACAGDFDESAQQASAVYAEAFVRDEPPASSTAAAHPSTAAAHPSTAAAHPSTAAAHPSKATFPPTLSRAGTSSFSLPKSSVRSKIEANLAPFLQPVPHLFGSGCAGLGNLNHDARLSRRVPRLPDRRQRNRLRRNLKFCRGGGAENTLNRGEQARKWNALHSTAH